MRMLKDVLNNVIRADLNHTTEQYRIIVVHSGEVCHSLVFEFSQAIASAFTSAVGKTIGVHTVFSRLFFVRCSLTANTALGPCLQIKMITH